MAQQLEFDFDEPPHLRPANPLVRPVRRASSLRVPVRGAGGSARVRAGRVPLRAAAGREGMPSGPDDPCFDAWRYAVYDPVTDGVDETPDEPGADPA